jgi:V8-like Glu-specific endopeptidase
MKSLLAAAVMVLCACNAGGLDDAATTTSRLTALDTTHVNAGALVYHNAAGHLRQACSGILISPTVFLTAGHCTSDPRFATSAAVTFDQSVTDASPIITGTAHTSPDYDPSHYNINSDMHDVGVVTLDAPVTDRAPAALPTANLLDAVHAAPGTPVTAVGYGLDQDGTSGHNVAYVTDRTRQSGTLKYRALTAWIMVDQVKADGACFGDSGGPDFMTINGQEQLVALNAVVNGFDCNEVAWLYRLDRPAERAFLSSYVAVP